MNIFGTFKHNQSLSDWCVGGCGIKVPIPLKQYLESVVLSNPVHYPPGTLFWVEKRTSRLRVIPVVYYKSSTRKSLGKRPKAVKPCLEGSEHD